MKNSIWFAGILVLLSLGSCVSAKQYDALRKDFKDLEQENDQLQRELSKTRSLLADNQGTKDKFESERKELLYETAGLKQERDLLQKKYDNLKSAYDALESSSSSALKENSERNRDLLRQIEEKQQKLDQETARLEKLQQDLDFRSQRIDELESAIAAKEEQMSALKNKISAALTNFEGKGLEVYQKNGKVYVSMENKLLFSSGSWEVNTTGREALAELGKVLAGNPDIQVLIEGHTDNVPYKGSGLMKNNWDLSTRRATAVVQILLQNGQIRPQNLTAAGRSKYAPVADNATTEGKAKNRRIEVILTPELDKLSELLESK